MHFAFFLGENVYIGRRVKHLSARYKHFSIFLKHYSYRNDHFSYGFSFFLWENVYVSSRVKHLSGRYKHFSIFLKHYSYRSFHFSPWLWLVFLKIMMLVLISILYGKEAFLTWAPFFRWKSAFFSPIEVLSTAGIYRSFELFCNSKPSWTPLICCPFSEKHTSERLFHRKKKCAKCTIAKDPHPQILSLVFFLWKLFSDKYVRSNRSNIEFPFIKALECVLFDFKAMWLKVSPVC